MPVVHPHLKPKSVEEVSIKNLAELEKFCDHLRAHLGERVLLLLDGPVGAGKTKTVELLLKAMGIHDVASPTFALHHRYRVRGVVVDHYDLYRIGNEDDLETIGFWENLAVSRGLIIVEWAERLNIDVLPTAWSIVQMKITLDALSGERVYQVKYY